MKNVVFFIGNEENALLSIEVHWIKMGWLLHWNENILAWFSRTFAAGNKIKQFYELLVEDSLRREDVDSLSRENMKNLHEIMQSFRFSNVCYWSYLSRTFIEILLSIGLFLIYFCWGMPNLEREIECNVHGLRHSCVLPNHQVPYFHMYWLCMIRYLERIPNTYV